MDILNSNLCRIAARCNCQILQVCRREHPWSGTLLGPEAADSTIAGRRSVRPLRSLGWLTGNSLIEKHPDLHSAILSPACSRGIRGYRLINAGTERLYKSGQLKIVFSYEIADDRVGPSFA